MEPRVTTLEESGITGRPPRFNPLTGLHRSLRGVTLCEFSDQALHMDKKTK